MTAGYSWLLFDLDGTLLGPDRTLHPHNVEVLQRLMQGGVRVSLASGRPPRSAMPYAEELGINGPLITFNGCVAVDVNRGTRLFERHLPRDAALWALKLAAARGVHANVYVADEICVEARTAIALDSEEKDGVPQRVVGPLPTFVRGAQAEVTKVLFIAPPEAVRALGEDIMQGPHRDVVHVVNSEPDYLELLPTGVTKQTAAVAVGGARGLSLDEAIAFGDNKNDIEMVRGARLGVAMQNADAALVEVADVVIGPHDGDAIARYLSDGFVLEDGRLKTR